MALCANPLSSGGIVVNTLFLLPMAPLHDWRPGKAGLYDVDAVETHPTCLFHHHGEGVTGVESRRSTAWGGLFFQHRSILEFRKLANVEEQLLLECI